MTYQEFKNKYNGKFVDYDGQYGAQCWDLGQKYFTECLGLPASILGGCGLVSNMLYPPKRNDLNKYFDEVRTDAMYPGDVCIWEYGHIAIFDHWDGKNCWYFSQNPNPSQVMKINAGGLHAFRLKGNKPTKISVSYQAYDNTLKKWLPVVNNLEDYAGIYGHSIGGIRAKSNDATITLQSHMKGGVWVSAITKWDNTPNGYSGIYGREIDMIMVKSNKGIARYRVHTTKSGWLGWVEKFNINDEVNGMAGNWGEPIDAIQIEIK